jgi:transcriptional regulator with XRE-family HTH domain
MEKAERLKKVFEFLRNKRLIKNQSDFAEKIGIVRSNISAALSGDERYLTRSVFYKICEAFSQISYEYLNEGKSRCS